MATLKVKHKALHKAQKLAVVPVVMLNVPMPTLSAYVVPIRSKRILVIPPGQFYGVYSSVLLAVTTSVVLKSMTYAGLLLLRAQAD